LSALISPAYRGLLPIDASVLYTVILFQQDRKSVIYSGAAKRALRPGEVLIAIGGAFTAEARDALKSAGAEIIALSEFPWTDDSYTEIRRRR
jgi:ethanolamine utilization microcompartment shell protein EutL